MPINLWTTPPQPHPKKKVIIKINKIDIKTCTKEIKFKEYRDIKEQKIDDNKLNVNSNFSTLKTSMIH